MPDTSTHIPSFSAYAGPSAFGFGNYDNPEAVTPRASHAGYDTLPTRAVGAGRLVPNSIPDYTPSIGNVYIGRNNTAGVIGQRSPPTQDLSTLMQSLTVAPFIDLVVTIGEFSYRAGETRSFLVRDCTPLDMSMIERILIVSTVCICMSSSLMLSTDWKVLHARRRQLQASHRAYRHDQLQRRP